MDLQLSNETSTPFSWNRYVLLSATAFFCKDVLNYVEVHCKESTFSNILSPKQDNSAILSRLHVKTRTRSYTKLLSQDIEDHTAYIVNLHAYITHYLGIPYPHTELCEKLVRWSYEEFTNFCYDYDDCMADEI